FIASGMLIPRSEPQQLVLVGHDPDQGRLGDRVLGVLFGQRQELRVVLVWPGILLLDDLLLFLRRLRLAVGLGILLEGVVVLLEQRLVPLFRRSRLLVLAFALGRHHRHA